MEEELISREEPTATLLAISDTREDVRRIRRAVDEEDDGGAEEDEP